MITLAQIESLEASISSALKVIQEIDGFVTKVKTAPVAPATPELVPNLEAFLGKLGDFFSMVEALGSKVTVPAPANPPPASPVA